MKYVNHEDLGIIIFPPSVTHKQIAEMLGGRILSAGFVDMAPCNCFGESVSLGIAANTNDIALLKAFSSLYATKHN